MRRQLFVYLDLIAHAQQLTLFLSGLAGEMAGRHAWGGFIYFADAFASTGRGVRIGAVLRRLKKM